MKFLLKYLMVSLLTFGIQALFIWMLYATPNQFIPTKTVTGTYVYGGGNAKSRTYTEIERVIDGHILREPLFCSVSIFGPVGSCERKYLNGSLVTAEIGRYKYLFGEGSVPVRITSNKQIIFDRDIDEWNAAWLSTSLIAAIFTSIVVGIFFHLVELNFFRKKG